MGYLLIGFMMGIIITLLWQKYYKGMPVFQLLMQRELALNGQLGSITALKKRMDQIEKKLANLEQDIIIPPEEEVSAKLEILPGVNHNNRLKGVAKTDRKIMRRKVLEMWAEGSSVAEIASVTNLGQGEIELIISMQANG